jgi:hypothetical protein
MADRLHGKYIITKAKDGRPVPYPCFVLRVDGKDRAAIDALRAYARATQNWELKVDLMQLADRADRGRVPMADFQLPALPERWTWDDDQQRMRPAVSRIHAIPLENSDTLIHCAQLTCWCTPRPDPDNDVLVVHNSVTTSDAGWVLIGELLPDGQDPVVVEADRAERGEGDGSS